jgi:hypothetical protein
MVRTQVQLTEEQAQAVKQMAIERGVSIAEIIRQSVDAFVRSGGRPSQAELRKRALAAAGAVRGGPPDLSERHDEYAVEAFED